MARLAILEFPDPRLRTRAAAVARFDAALARLLDDMHETMRAARGIGLAATQVDVHQRVLVMDVSEAGDEPQEYVNAELLAREGSEAGEEGCLSVPEVNEKVTRATRVRVRAQDRAGQWFERELEGLAAVCLQHELDHLEGRLFVDYLSSLKRERIRRRIEKEQRAREAEAPARARAR